jgi:hypothetical protein
MRGIAMRSTTDAHMISTRVWSGGKLPLMELCTLWRVASGHILQGHVTGVQEHTPFTLHYRVECDEAWRTRRVSVELDTPPRVHELHLVVDDAQRWSVNGEHHARLDGLLDVDIQVSPSTNTLPIRRLDMMPGREYPVTAAWVKVPSLMVEPLSQEYARIDARHLRYRSANFKAELEVDEHGMVERYADLWRRIDLK